jgi:hypothetical protein
MFEAFIIVLIFWVAYRLGQQKRCFLCGKREEKEEKEKKE